MSKFNDERAVKQSKMKRDSNVRHATDSWISSVREYDYVYNFDWLGIPVIQFPNDLVVLQEVLYESKPQLIIETGIARGGSASFFSSILALLDLMECEEGGPPKVRRKYLGIDIDIRQETKSLLKQHPILKMYASTIEGSSISENVLKEVDKISKDFNRVMVVLDSNHTEVHVLSELIYYSKFVTKDCFLVVCDTSIEWDSKSLWMNKREWGPGNNPMTAITKFLERNIEFSIREDVSDKALISSMRNGFLQRRHNL